MSHRALLLPFLAVAVSCTSTAEPTPPTDEPRDLAAPLADVMVPGFTPTPLDVALARLDLRGDWEDHGRALAVPRHPAEKHLAGMVIVLDPGHGGKADVPGYKRGPTGVREAEMNLRVAHLLRRLLVDAGATVALTREGEISDAADDRLPDTHRRRAAIANEFARPDGGVGADLFISLHHNASSSPEANYPSVWFHGEADWSEPALDAALAVGLRIGAELRCGGVGKTGVLMSDQQMYRSGFAVLRHATVPAFLVEASFFSHPVEEQRLRDAAYNLREAYAIYLGLVEYASGGRPTQTTPLVTVDAGVLTLTTTLDEGLPAWWGHERQRTLASTIAVSIAGEPVLAQFDPPTKTVRAQVPFDPARHGGGTFDVAVHHANLYKHHNWPQHYAVTLRAEGPADVRSQRGPHADG